MSTNSGRSARSTVQGILGDLQRSRPATADGPAASAEPPAPAVPAQPDAPPAAQAAGRRGTGRAPTVRISQDTADQLRDAVIYLRGHGQPTVTITTLVDQAVRGELVRILNQYSLTEFPHSDLTLPRGRVAGT